MRTYEICTYLASDFIATFVLTPDDSENRPMPNSLVIHPLTQPARFSRSFAVRACAASALNGYRKGPPKAVGGPV